MEFALFLAYHQFLCLLSAADQTHLVECLQYVAILFFRFVRRCKQISNISEKLKVKGEYIDI